MNPNELNIEHLETSIEKCDEKVIDLLKQMDGCIELMEEFLNVNQIHPYVALNCMINTIPVLAKQQKMPFNTLKSLMMGTLDTYEKRWDEL